MSDENPSEDEQTERSVDVLEEWVAETAERRGISEQEVLDDISSSYQMIEELSGSLSETSDEDRPDSAGETGAQTADGDSAQVDDNETVSGLEALESDLDRLRPAVEKLSQGLSVESADEDHSGTVDDGDESRPEDNRNENSSEDDSDDNGPEGDGWENHPEDDGREVDEPASFTQEFADSSPASEGQPTGRHEFEELLENVDAFGQTTTASQVLIVSPGSHTITNDVLAHFLTSERTADENILFVSTKEIADDQLPVVRDIATWTDARTALVDVGHTGFDSSSAQSNAIRDQFDIHRAVSKPSNIAKLGVIITQLVSQLSESNSSTVLGFHTLSSLQQFVGTQTLFQFLYTLHSQLESSDIRGYYHIDSLAHDERDMATFTSLFDLVVRVSPDGSVEIE